MCLAVKDGSTANGAQLELVREAVNLKTKFGVYFDTDQFDYEIDDFFAQTPANPSSLKDTTSDTDNNIYVRKDGGDYVLCLNNNFVNNKINVAVYDATGKIVYTDQYDATTDQIVLNIPMILSSGIYLVNIWGNNSRASAKFMVNN